jgi:hypothetical protein
MRRALVVGVVSALFVGVWLGSAGTTGKSPTPGFSLNALGIDDSATTTTTTTPTQNLTPPPAAPSDYSSQLESLYGQIYTVSQTLPATASTAGLATPSQFAAQLASADPSDVNYIAEQLPETTISSLSSALTPATADESALVSHLKITRSSRSATHHGTGHATAHVGAHQVTVQSPTIITETMPTDDPYTGDVSSNTYTASCPAGAPPINSADTYGEGDIFAIQIAIDVVDGVYNGLSPGAGTDSPVGIGIYIAAAVLAAIGLALQVADDTLSYFQTVAGDCQQAQMQQVGIDTDNNSYQTYQLLKEVGGTANEIDQNLANLANQDQANFESNLALVIEEALAAPIGTTPMSALELPDMYDAQSYGGYLNSTPVGVDEVVSSTIQSMQTLGQTISPTATRDLSLAEQAESAGEFKLAFDYYRLSYQAAAG